MENRPEQCRLIANHLRENYGNDAIKDQLIRKKVPCGTKDPCKVYAEYMYDSKAAVRCNPRTGELLNVQYTGGHRTGSPTRGGHYDRTGSPPRDHRTGSPPRDHQTRPASPVRSMSPRGGHGMRTSEDRGGHYATRSSRTASPPRSSVRASARDDEEGYRGGCASGCALGQPYRSMSPTRTVFQGGHWESARRPGSPTRAAYSGTRAGSPPRRIY